MKVLGLLLRNWGGKVNIIKILLSLSPQFWLLLSQKLLEAATKRFLITKVSPNIFIWVGEFSMAYKLIGLSPPAQDEWGFGITIKF